MSVNLKLRERLPTEAIILDSPAFDNSIIGTTLDGSLIYSYECMVSELQTDEQWSEDEAVEWINFNTMRAIPYMGEKSPIIVSIEAAAVMKKGDK